MRRDDINFFSSKIYVERQFLGGKYLRMGNINFFPPRFMLRGSSLELPPWRATSLAASTTVAAGIPERPTQIYIWRRRNKYLYRNTNIISYEMKFHPMEFYGNRILRRCVIAEAKPSLFAT